MAKTRPSQPRNGATRQETARRPWVAAAALSVAAVAVVGLVLARGGGGDDGRTAAQVSALPGLGSSLEQGGQADGSPLPDVEFEMLDGAEMSFADFRGKPLVINFFASWCGACLAELPQFQEVYAANREHVQFLGVNLQDSRAAAEELVDWAALTYPIAVDAQGQLFAGLGAYAMPTTVFVHADGTIAELHGGELDADELGERLRRHAMIPQQEAA
jgi:thiol-disulfide isomerase/thioredoxin